MQVLTSLLGVVVLVGSSVLLWLSAFALFRLVFVFGQSSLCP